MQTSAHAEMDPHDFISRVPGDANLRSRGDGPSCSGITRLPCHKPPLTRRWTLDALKAGQMSEQTSAHAEMDLEPVFVRRHVLPNLRSRGDGPKVGAEIARTVAKPPLTRRWTHLGHDVLDLVHQTSAHAEMDLRNKVKVEAEWTNLRSRGDGPASVASTQCVGVKPPLTRRWTRCHRAAQRRSRQTSAHAEMDLAPATQTKIFKPNLRSRGDGPKPRLRGHFLFCKPPLTRRWTPDLLRRQRRRRQTSAHAEMDPTTRRTTPTVFPNLRSRGDGPALLAFGALRSGKPPLTRG